MAPSIFSVVSPSPLSGTLLRLSALASLGLAGTKLYLAPSTTAGIADQPLSSITAPAKAEKLAVYQDASWFIVGALLQLRWSYTGLGSVLDKAAFFIVALQYAAGGIGSYRIGFSRPAYLFAGGLLPMLGALIE
ncbi:MAG: hypothetical protein CYPHOPRED_002018 [Cyphobasidiales sp. Tagirdzhanova-0007]|nr:MAG: hypothetical protein CYPHOPRED_002018 [Cyphobasidiales sp. Tagirdzhanova-0007]